MAIDCSRVSLILLAAGRSERFGSHKLSQPLAGWPLAHHAAHTLSQISFGERVAVVGPVDLDISRFGFRLVESADNAPMSKSIERGVAAVLESDCDACLIALADMPLVPENHFRALLDAHEGRFTATDYNGVRTVPAVFSRDTFPLLSALTGDRGAVSLLSEAKAVPAEAAWMQDVDTRDDLDRLRTEVRKGRSAHPSLC
jgi:molybdenum cofactor cytidylyltransferase